MSDETAASRETKACPFCAEEILQAAIKCKHCHSMLSDPPDEAAAPQTPSSAPAGTKSGCDAEKEKSFNSFMIAIWLVFGTLALVDGREMISMALYSYALFIWSEIRFYRKPTEESYMRIRHLFWVSEFFSSLALIGLALTAGNKGDTKMTVIWFLAAGMNLFFSNKKKKEMMAKAKNN